MLFDFDFRFYELKFEKKNRCSDFSEMNEINTGFFRDVLNNCTVQKLLFNKKSPSPRLESDPKLFICNKEDLAFIRSIR